MCVNLKEIRNPYTHKVITVKCGRCPACMREKSVRCSSRILAEHNRSDVFGVFLTLTYNNQFIPYIRLSDIDPSSLEEQEIPIYRDYLYKKTYSRYKGHKVSIIPNDKPIDKLVIKPSQLDSIFNTDFQYIQKHPVYDSVSINYTRDFSLFIHRLRKTLQRYYKIDLSGVLSYCSVFEYGPTTHRAHIHSALYLPKSYLPYLSALRRAVASCWPYCAPNQFYKSGKKSAFSLAASPAQYIGGYLSSADLAGDFFSSSRRIAQKTTISKLFGHRYDIFTPSYIQAAVSQSDFKAILPCYDFNGKLLLSNIRIPSYVLRRYFPRIPCSSLFSNETICSILQCPDRIYSYTAQMRAYGLSDPLTTCKRYVSSINNACHMLHMHSYDYMVLYNTFRSRYASYTLMHSFDDVVFVNDLSEHYLNPLFIDYHSNNPNFFVGFPITSLSPNDYKSYIDDNESAKSYILDHVKRSKLNDVTTNHNINYFLKPRKNGKKCLKIAKPSCEAFALST